MKKIISRIILIIIIFILIIQVKSMAAVIVSTDKQVESDSGNVTISITSKQALGAYTLKLTDTAGLTLVSASAGEGQVSSDNKTITGSSASGTTNLGSFTFKVPSVTEDKKYNIKFSITGMETPNLESVENETNTAVLTVKAKVQTPVTPTESETPTTPQTPTTPTVTEPTFTQVNEKVYATESINVRESFSTSSKIVGNLQKGEEITRIGKGSNGWSKVTYKGTTAYISTSLLTTIKPEEEKKSDNAYLKSLTIEGQELTPTFNKETTSYTMQVTSNIVELNIKAEAEDEKATTSIQGNKDLKDGENIVTISVNAEDGTTKIYEIKVTKSGKIALGLKSLIIEGTDIESDFRPELYEYEIDIEDVTNLQIEAIANDETATVEILGNEDLQDGENIITIIVSSQDGKEKVTYQITANKIAEKISTVEENTKIVPKVYLYIALGVVVLIALIIVIVYTIRHRNTDEYDFSDNFDGFSKELPEKNEDNVLFSDNNKEETKEVDISNEEPENSDGIDKIGEETIEDKKAKIDYAVDDEEENEKPRRKKGKHF